MYNLIKALREPGAVEGAAGGAPASTTTSVPSEIPGFSAKDLENLSAGKLYKGPEEIPAPPATQQAAPAAAAAVPPGGEAAKSAEGAPTTAATQAQKDAHQTWLEANGFKSVDEANQRIQRVSALEKELNEVKTAPKFKSKQAEMLADFANQYEGMEWEAAQRYLSLQRTPLDKMPDHEKRLLAFQLDPLNKGLTQEELYSLFSDEELRTFGDPKSTEAPQTPIQVVRAKQATIRAEQTLQKMQDDYAKARPAEAKPEDIAAQQAKYLTKVQEQLKGFDGLNLKLVSEGKDGKKSEGALAYKLDATQIPGITSAVADPQGWWDGLLTRMGVMVPGQDAPNLVKWAEIAAKIENFDSIVNKTYQQGQEDMLARTLLERRNPQGGEGAGAGDGSTAPTKTAYEEMVEGVAKLVGG